MYYSPTTVQNHNVPLQHTDERVFPIIPFLTGLVAGPLLYQAFNPYYNYPYPVYIPYGYHYNYNYYY
ncbi:hypothetical protein [Ornithinibacillus scapharcae]|uniref:hypothetical protein n=1 Tax=Ornithinibacillus scapharcae TaxID=1147159 RepID=UPI00031804D9|nr:hypothetical protein [Ornithinibacillus scapharcae]